MKDRNVEFPNRYRMTKVPGTDDIFDLIQTPGEVFEEGDFLNKSTLLTDALCTALGLATTATPTQAMDKLRQQIGSTSDNLTQLVNTTKEEVLAADLRIELGSYTGTGSSTVTIPFSFSPAFIIVFKSSSSQNTSVLGLFMRNSPYGYAVGPSYDYIDTSNYGANVYIEPVYPLKINQWDNTVKFTNASYASAGLNNNKTTHYYFALG